MADANDFTTGFAIGPQVTNAPDDGWWAFVTMRYSDTGAQLAIPISGIGSAKKRTLGTGQWCKWSNIDEGA